MRILTNLFIVISNLFWTEYLYWDFKIDLVKINEAFGYEFGMYLALILFIIILWIPFFKSKYNRKWAVVGIGMNTLLVSPMAIIGYILRWKLCPRKIKTRQLEVIE